jgi:hypothetical protein
MSIAHAARLARSLSTVFTAEYGRVAQRSPGSATGSNPSKNGQRIATPTGPSEEIARLETLHNRTGWRICSATLLSCVKSYARS